MREHQGRLIFLDETSTNTKMTKATGRCLKGERLFAKAPFGHWGTQTLIAGLKSNGLVAPWVINAPMNRVIFDTYVETQLAPILKPGDVVILDNLAAHKSERAENIVRAKGAWLLFLPPDLPQKFHPAAFRVSGSCMPLWAGDATGWHAEPRRGVA
jgi:hypothetical protein